MKKWKTWLAQALLYGLFALFVGVFSRWPAWQALPPQQAVLKVSFIHHGQRIAPCRPATPEELAKLAPNMRTPLKCERERAPVEIEVDLDGASVLRHVAQPSGLSRDGPSSVYHRLNVAAGEHRIRVRLKDAAGGTFGYTRETTLRLAPAQVLVIDFDPEKGGITFS
ncbi:hypothetical protein GCM10028796_58670 [Ramlibacter monticola]|uniref:Uncharacterized protein n=1 Tax=Ramlibacter monticola TaxID=1926872 RepID=A0A937CVW2_9BURK|nr:hypothetical protein [Ramlibacter monticola]MBL0393994.1 hypothetical protein [Ramlibacter monticola]